MSASKKLSLAVKALYVLDQYDGQPLSSGQIAKALGVNSSKLRRLLSMLVKSHLIESIQGTSGGFVLKRKPDQIDLQEIYCSVEEKKAFYLDVHDHLGIGSSSARMNDYFLDLFSDVQVVIEDKMRHITLRDFIKKVNG